MITEQEYLNLIKEVDGKNTFIKGEYIYFVAGHKLFMDMLCRVKINKERMFILNRKQNLMTRNVEIYNSYLEKRSNGVRGYKTIKIGVIEEYCYIGALEYATKGGDIDGFYWWIDRESKVQLPSSVKTEINEIVNNAQSKFVAA